MPEPIRFPSPPSRKSNRRILNAQTIRGLKVPDKGRVDYFDDMTPGLSLRITSNNVRTWTLFYRTASGRQKRLALGRYPAVPLADARELAGEAVRKIAKGRDPAAEKRAARDAYTFGKLATDYLDLHAKVNKRSWKEDERMLNADLLPKWKNRPATEITRRDIAEIVSAKLRTKAPIGSNRLHALLSKIFSFAVEKGLLEHSPVFGTKRPAKETRRERVLSPEEIRRICSACNSQSARVAAWFRLRLVTAQRGGEILQMRWRDLDDAREWWTIPAEFVKNAQGHRVYLNDQARKILAGFNRTEESVWVFPRSLMGDFKHVARRLAQPTRANIVKASNGSDDQRVPADFTGHDLRRTAASCMTEGGVPRFVVSRILNHSEAKDITGVYDRYSYDAEKRAAMEFWGRQLSAVLKGEPLASVGRFTMQGT